MIGREIETTLVTWLQDKAAPEKKKIMGARLEGNFNLYQFHFQFFHFPDIISLVKTCILIKS